MDGSPAGITKRIRKAVGKTIKVRHRWQVCCQGAPKLHSQALLDKLRSGHKVNADVVVLVLGIADYLQEVDMQIYAANVQEIIECFEPDQCVIACTIPICWERDLEKEPIDLSKLKARNEILHFKLTELKTKKALHGVVRIDDPACGRQELFTHDLLHFNSSGYDVFFGKLLPSLRNAMITTEWRLDKQMLRGA